MEILAIVIIVSNMILIGWFMCNPAMVHVTFVRSTGEHDIMATRPAKLPGGVLVVSAGVPEELQDISMVGCVITVTSLRRVLDVSFERPVRLGGSVGIVISPDGDGQISFAEGSCEPVVQTF